MLVLQRSLSRNRCPSLSARTLHPPIGGGGSLCPVKTADGVVSYNEGEDDGGGGGGGAADMRVKPSVRKVVEQNTPARFLPQRREGEAGGKTQQPFCLGGSNQRRVSASTVNSQPFVSREAQHSPTTEVLTSLSKKVVIFGFASVGRRSRFQGKSYVSAVGRMLFHMLC